MKIISAKKVSSLKETEDFARELAHMIKPGTAIGFEGDLGAGKTTLSRILVKNLGSKEEVTSPSYVLQHEYVFDGGIIEHWDLYRLKSCPEELQEPLSPKNIRIIEWSNKFPELLRTLDLVLKIEILSESEREFLLSTP